MPCVLYKCQKQSCSCHSLHVTQPRARCSAGAIVYVQVPWCFIKRHSIFALLWRSACLSSSFCCDEQECVHLVKAPITGRKPFFYLNSETENFVCVKRTRRLQSKYFMRISSLCQHTSRTCSVHVKDWVSIATFSHDIAF